MADLKLPPLLMIACLRIWNLAALLSSIRKSTSLLKMALTATRISKTQHRAFSNPSFITHL
ncbi:MAG: hypothetical protein J7497_12815 [Chitinophagaceae bacterium]|nr:hypothetical protein [Chitinophagaceae bacterium]